MVKKIKSVFVQILMDLNVYFFPNHSIKALNEDSGNENGFDATTDVDTCVCYAQTTASQRQTVKSSFQIPRARCYHMQIMKERTISDKYYFITKIVIFK